MKVILSILVLILISSSIQLSFQQNETENGEKDPWVVLDYEFLKEIILISMPIIAGFLTTRHLTNKWQKNKEKADIKKIGTKRSR